jgi:lipopolysaccharide export LptBFGC system permease protein LptF
MKKSILISLLVTTTFFIVGCQESTKKKTESSPNKETKELSILEKIANANGYENWKDVNKITYTFNVDRDSSHFQRTWHWSPKEEKVTLISSKDTINYHTSQKDSTLTKTDQAFINDKYWLLFPFQLVWDKGFDYTVKEEINSPLHKEILTEISISYNNEDGYTPGDMYKIYINKDYMIKEWSFHPQGAEKAALVNTWEDYESQKGIKFAKMHQDSTGSFKLYFTNVSIQ